VSVRLIASGKSLRKVCDKHKKFEYPEFQLSNKFSSNEIEPNEQEIQLVFEMVFKPREERIFVIHIRHTFENH